VEVNK